MHYRKDHELQNVDNHDTILILPVCPTVLQDGPPYPAGQLQLNVLPSITHVPPFLQGW